MPTVLLFGLVASGSLVLGGLIGAVWRPPKPLVAVALAFASGALVSALAFDLFAVAFRGGGAWSSGAGFLGGAAAFIFVDAALERSMGTSGEGGGGFALLAAALLDGLPENTALGVSLMEDAGGGGLALLVAICAANIPEALGGAVGMRDQGRSRVFVIGTWTAAGALLAVPAVAGGAVLSRVGGDSLSVILAFAAGAVLAALADTLMPDAYREGGPFVAFATVVGFFTSFLLSQM